MSPDEAFAELEETSGITESEWRDILSEDPDDQLMIIQDWQSLGKLSWTAEVSTFERVMSLLGIIGTIAGVVGGVAGATTAVAAFRGL